MEIFVLILRNVAAANMKKCRARYGLDQQNLWCKPCRWGSYFPFFCISAFHFGYFSGFSVGILENENYTVDSIITQLRPVMYLILMKPDRSGGVGDVLITASPNVLIADRPAHNGARGKEIGVGLVYNYHQNQSLSQWAPTARLILFPNSSWEWPTTNLVGS